MSSTEPQGSPFGLETADKLEALATQLTAAAQAIRGGSSFDHAAPFTAAREVVHILSPPGNEFAEAAPVLSLMASLRLFMKWKVFQAIPSTGTISYADLAAKVGAEVALIQRFAWILVARGVLKQVGTDHIAHTPRSLPYGGTNALTAMIKMGFDDHLKAIALMPAFFDKYGLKDLNDRLHTVLAFAEGEPGKPVWELMNRDPDRMATFMLSMAAHERLYPVLGSYDLSWVARAASAAEGASDRVLVVDVGGGGGHCLREICRSTSPRIPPARCVLEDLPDVLAAAEAKLRDDPDLGGLQFRPTDFHAGQPVRGALVYYLRRCLHDYGDDDCVQILRHLAEAMAADSRLLIVEQVLSNPPSLMGAAINILIGSIGGKERTLDGFREIAGRAGLKINEVFPTQGTDAAVIECSKA